MPMCQFFQPTRNASTDGLLPSESTFFLDNDIFGDKVQVLAAVYLSCVDILRTRFTSILSSCLLEDYVAQQN